MFLLLTNSIIPIIGYLFIGFCRSSKLTNTAFKTLPILFLMNLVGLNSAFGQNINLNLFKIFSDLSFGFTLDKFSLIFLFLLGFIWLIFTFYLKQVFSLKEEEIEDNFKLKITAIFALLNLLIISNNLVTSLFFYSFLLLLNHFFAQDFLYKNNAKFSLILKLTFYSQAFLIFVAVALTDDITGNLSFSSLPNSSHFNLIYLYFFALFSVFLFPYIFYNSVKNSDIFALYLSFFIINGGSALVIFTKTLKSIFITELLSKLFTSAFFQYFEFLILTTSFLSILMMLFVKDLKAVFFYLLSQQVVIASFSIILFGAFDFNKIHLPLLSSILQTTLTLLVFSNFIFYLEKLKITSIKGLFHNLKITSSLLIFTALTLIGIFPTIVAYEKFFIIKTLFQKELLLPSAVFVLNFVGVFILGCKLSYLLISKFEIEDKKKKPSENLELEDLSNYDLNLALIPLVLAVTMIFLPIFLQFKIGIFAL